MPRGWSGALVPPSSWVQLQQERGSLYLARETRTAVISVQLLDSSVLFLLAYLYTHHFKGWAVTSQKWQLLHLPPAPALTQFGDPTTTGLVRSLAEQCCAVFFSHAVARWRATSFITGDLVIKDRKQLSVSLQGSSGEGRVSVLLQTGCKVIAGEVALQLSPLSLFLPWLQLHLKEDQND